MSEFVPPPATTPPLARLVALRRVEVVAQGCVIALATLWLRIPLDVLPMIGASAALGGFNLLTQWRLERGWPVTHNELFAHLSVDVGVLTVLLYFAGGSANPFVSLFLLPPTLAAAMLPARQAWAMAGVALVAYTWLMFWNQPLPPPQGELATLDRLFARVAGVAPEHAGHLSGFSLHVMGMWLNFLISVSVAVFYLTRMAAALKSRERELAAAREAILRHEQILSLGTLAAGAAHKLGTPLATMAVVIRELELGKLDTNEAKEDIGLLRQQVDVCKQTISQLLASAGQARDTTNLAVPLDTYLSDLLDEWRLIRPRTPISITLGGEQPAPTITADRTLEQAVLNLLDNAADAHGENREPLHFHAEWDKMTLRLEIVDCGPGLASEVARQIGQPFVTSKRNTGEGAGGIGIGLFLTNATLERLGGKVELFNRDRQAGACTRVTLPLERLKAPR